jgi:putative chitinase
MNRAVFFNAIRPMFDGSLGLAQVARIEAILDGLESRKVNVRHAAYILGTAHHESGKFIYMQEIWGPTPAQRRYEGRKKDLGNVVKGDGKKFLGRGFVQITGRANYKDWSRRLGVDLVKEPHLATLTQYAVPILIDGMLLGTFTGVKLGDFSSYREMRRVVNQMDQADKIAGYAVDYEDALRRASYGLNAVPKPVDVAKPDIKQADPKPPIGKPTPTEERNIWDALFAFIIKLFGGRK